DDGSGLTWSKAADGKLVIGNGEAIAIGGKGYHRITMDAVNGTYSISPVAVTEEPAYTSMFIHGAFFQYRNAVNEWIPVNDWSEFVEMKMDSENPHRF